MRDEIIVIGGGVVGVSCALFLQKSGHSVTLIEKTDIGKQTSHGNSGVITRGSIYPMNNPKLWSNLPKFATNRHPAFRYSISYLARNIGWLASFLGNATEISTRNRAAELNTLIEGSLPLHKKLMSEAGIEFRLRENGWLKLFRNISSFDNSAFERDILDQNNVSYQELNAHEVSDLEPYLKPVFKRGILVTDTASVNNPSEVVQAYARLFISLGGKIEWDNIKAVEKTDSGFSVLGSNHKRAAKQLVIATGPWANDLLGKLGYHFPMCCERGYHNHYRSLKDASLSRPYHDVDSAYVMSPTDLGLRVTTGTELKERSSWKTPNQLQQVLPSVREAFPLGESCQAEPWHGSRPSMPDAKPVIGEIPKMAGLWCAFGHQHIGFSTGPISGLLLSSLLNGEKPPVDPSPFSPDRFIANTRK